MIAYELDGVSFAYGGGPPVLSVPRLLVQAGSITAFRGPNGAGKTTLLQLLAFLTQTTAGSIRFHGEPVRHSRLPAFRRRACLLQQNPYLFRGTVRTNVEWALRVRRVAAAERSRRAEEALDRVGLRALGDRPARELSGGESQRVALARILALDPQAVCLDEPTNHIDTAGCAAIESILAEWVTERGVTLLIATHDMGFAHRLGAETWQLRRGELCPAEPDNILDGRVATTDPARFETHGAVLHVHPLQPGVRCVRIAPREVVLLQSVQSSSARNQLKGHITAMTPLDDDEVLVRVACGITLNVVITRASWDALQLACGGPVVAAFKASAVHAC